MPPPGNAEPGKPRTKCEEARPSPERRCCPRRRYSETGPRPPCGGSFGALAPLPHEKKQQKQDALQSEIAPFGAEPFLRGMRAPARPACSDSNCRNTHGQGDIGVGRRGVQVGADPEVGVDRANKTKDSRVFR